MKIYLSNEELKTVRDSLYRQREGIQEDMKKQSLIPKLTEILEEKIADIEKILCYVSEHIEEEYERRF